MKTFRIIFSIFLATVFATNTFAAVTSGNLFPLTIIHVNDFHSRFEQTSNTSSTCKEPAYCIGGYARMVTVMRELKANAQNNPIYLFAGDMYQGTIWYNLLRWPVVSHFLNLYPPDAMTIGNHEFDHGIEGLAPFLKSISNPVVVANMDDSRELRMQGLYKKSVILTRNGMKIGVIGVLASETEHISKVENLKLSDEVEAVKAEAAALNAQGVKIILVLSHTGIDMERKIAKEAGPYIDVIVGGHSHTFLYHGRPPTEYGIKVDEYPVIIEQEEYKRKVYIVQAGSFTRFVGNFTVFFDTDGNIVAHEGNPVFLGNGIIQDPTIMKHINLWKEKLGETEKWVFGESSITLDRNECDRGECSLGNHIADAYKYAFTSKLREDQKNDTVISMLNVGGLRTSIDKGITSYVDIIGVLPFENNLKSFDVLGSRIRAALEHSVSEIIYVLDSARKKRILMLSGLHVWYNFKNPVNQRVVNVRILCEHCRFGYEPLDDNKYYRVIMPTFLADGGDGFDMFKDCDKNVIIGETDLDAVKNYWQQFSPLGAKMEGRIVFFNLIKKQ